MPEPGFSSPPPPRRCPWLLVMNYRIFTVGLCSRHNVQIGSSPQCVCLFSDAFICYDVGLKLTNLLHGAESFLRSQQSPTYSGNPQHFTVFEGPLLCSQEPTTGPYPDPGESIPYHLIIFL
jgi:hypothetical protein